MPVGAARAEGPPVPVLQAAHLRVRDVAEPARHADAGVQAQDLPGSLGGAEPDAGLVEVVELLRLARQNRHDLLGCGHCGDCPGRAGVPAIPATATAAAARTCAARGAS